MAQQNVLFVFSSLNQQRHDLDSFESVLRARVPQRLTFHTSYVDFERLGDSAYKDSLAETFYHAYKDVKLDVVVVCSIEALQFVTHYRGKIFPGVPIVFYGLNAKELELVGQRLPDGVTGLTSDVGVGQTIDLALRLHPDAQAFAIVTESQDFWWRVAHSEQNRHRARVKEIDLYGVPGNELLESIVALPPHTLILFQLATLSGKESYLTANDVLAAASSHLPTYCAWKTSFILGCVGGAYVDWDKYVESTAETTVRVLAGERPENIPVADDSNFQVQVDWRQLHRWNIRESALPPGSLIRYREPTIWESYHNYIIAAIALFLAQTLLIAALLWHRARKRKVEAALRESEKRFRVMADTMPSLVWMCDPHGKITYLNERRLEFTDLETGTEYGDSWIAPVHPDDLKNMQDGLANALKGHQAFSQVYRLLRKDGAYRWMHDVASPRVNGDGAFAGFIGSAIDMTEQKLAQQSLEMMSRRLIEARERECSRIARELHDDICQRLAVLSLEIEGAQLASAVPDINTSKSLERIGILCGDISSDVQGLSHQLHSSILDILGVRIAIKGFCDELSKRHDLQIEFTARNVPDDLSKEVSLCLFRVTQEALHNAVRCSGVSLFTVELNGSTDAIQLTVTDKGTGFDPKEVRQLGGLGLVSMQERVHLVHGAFSVESRPGEGTRITAIVPWPGAEQGDSDDQSAPAKISGWGGPSLR